MGRVNSASNEQISTIQREVLIGTLLGDDRLESRSKNGSARLRVHHAESQRDFLFWKYQVFQNLVTRKPWKVTWIGKQTGNQYSSWFFHTKTLYALREVHQLFYSVGKKNVPLNIGKLLTPRALAVWFMDDGCMTPSSAILNTQCFSKTEQEILRSWFRSYLGIETSFNKDRLNYRLRMNQKSARKLSDLIDPYVPECMQYKLAPRND